MPTHQVAKPNGSPGRPTMNAAAAAGLRMCRPRQANRYLVITATSAARARPTSPSRSMAGVKMNSSSRAVITVELSCGLVRKMSPAKPLAR